MASMPAEEDSETHKWRQCQHKWRQTCNAEAGNAHCSLSPSTPSSPSSCNDNVSTTGAFVSTVMSALTAH
eukprot:2699490-Rhodomonas_salina.2